MINLPPDFFERIVREQQTLSGVVQVLSELRLKYASRIQFASVTEALGLKNLGAAIESVLNAIDRIKDVQDPSRALSKTPVPFLESHPRPWTVEWNTLDDDDAFDEWWTVIDANGEPIARACSEEAAAWIVAAAGVTT